MSPEQALGGEIGPPSDIFSLGAVLTFAATGRGPFGRGSRPELAYRLVYGPPDLGEMPAGLRPLVEHCLAKDPAQRPTADEVLDAANDGQPAPGWLPGAALGALAPRRVLPRRARARQAARAIPGAPLVAAADGGGSDVGRARGVRRGQLRAGRPAGLALIRREAGAAGRGLAGVGGSAARARGPRYPPGFRSRVQFARRPGRGRPSSRPGRGRHSAAPQPPAALDRLRGRVAVPLPVA